MNWGALHARYAESYASVVDFIVTELFQECVGYLCEAETFLRVDNEGYYWHTVKQDSSNLKYYQTIFKLLIKVTKKNINLT